VNGVYWCLTGRQPGEAESPLISEPWFIATLIVLIGAVVWAVLCIFSVWIYRRHNASKKIPKNRARPGQNTDRQINEKWRSSNTLRAQLDVTGKSVSE